MFYQEMHVFSRGLDDTAPRFDGFFLPTHLIRRSPVYGRDAELLGVPIALSWGRSCGSFRFFPWDFGWCFSYFLHKFGHLYYFLVFFMTSPASFGSLISLFPIFGIDFRGFKVSSASFGIFQADCLGVLLTKSMNKSIC